MHFSIGSFPTSIIISIVLVFSLSKVRMRYIHVKPLSVFFLMLLRTALSYYLMFSVHGTKSQIYGLE